MIVTATDERTIRQFVNCRSFSTRIDIAMPAFVNVIKLTSHRT